MIGFRKYWYGKECEGRLTDVETLFISDIDGLHLDEIELMPHINYWKNMMIMILIGML